jgi:predicted dithiol-disulfide oxidoreductase (DUF899 family)
MATAVAEHLPKVVSYDEWLSARKTLLAKEKALTQAQDRLNAERRQLPMVRVEKDYLLEGPRGPVRLLDLFNGREQLIVHHFMLGPDDEHMCAACAAGADSIPRLRQLHARNTTLIALSRAPYPKLATYAQRMSWTFPWFSSYGSDFNYDFHATLDTRVAPLLVDYMTEPELAERARSSDTYSPWDASRNGSEWPWVNVFLRVGDAVYLTYSSTARGIEQFHCAHPYLDLTPLGRQEEWEEPKGGAKPLGPAGQGPYRVPPDQYDNWMPSPASW